jgi:RNA polymerase-binding transcription factor DksA
MTEAEIESYRTRLLDLLCSLNHEMTHLQDDVSRRERSGELTDVPLHPADLGTHRVVEQVALDLAGRERHTAEEVVSALNRIAEGTFGRCERCGEDIGSDCLRDLPYARHCAACAREVQ